MAKSPDPRDESEEERADRNLGELLQELRVAGLGVLAGAARQAAAEGASLQVVCARRRRSCLRSASPRQREREP